MDIRTNRKYILTISVFLGVIVGYVILHPFGMIIHALFRLHGEGYVHISWDIVAPTFIAAFSRVHLIQALLYIVLSGTMGYFAGKTVVAYRTINEQLQKFSHIGMNAASIVHDLNNPLSGIKGYVYLLQKRIEDPHQLSDLKKLEEQSEHLSRMITDIKIVAQGAKQIELSKSPTYIRPFLESAISDMAIHSEINIDEKSDMEVPIDRDYMGRVVWNVVTNADQALNKAEHGKIEISSEELKGHVVISISDNGPGIPQKELKHLFSLGQTFGKKGGTGIGLYNCKKIIEAHGGKIWIISEMDKGTKVYIKIPK